MAGQKTADPGSVSYTPLDVYTRQELKKAEKRTAEVDGLFAKMYEDWSAGRITEYNFNKMCIRDRSKLLYSLEKIVATPTHYSFS